MAFNFGYPMNPPRDLVVLPSEPTNLQVLSDSETQVTISWDASIVGDFPIIEYEVIANEALIGTVPTLSYPWDSVPANEAIDYKVRAVDNQGNRGAFSDIVSYTNVVDEYILDDDFIVNIDGWNPDGGAILSNENEALRITDSTANSGSVYAWKSIVTVIGQDYEAQANTLFVSTDLGGSGLNFGVNDNTYTGTALGNEAGILSDTYISIPFTAISELTIIRFNIYASATNAYADFDDVRVLVTPSTPIGAENVLTSASEQIVTSNGDTLYVKE